MKKLNIRIGSLVLLLFVVLLPRKVLAQEFLKFDNFNLDGEEQTVPFGISNQGYGDYMQFYIGKAGRLEFRITGYELTTTKKYVVEMTSDFLSFSKKFTGEELMNGQLLTIEDGKSDVLVKVHEEGQNIVIPYKLQNDCTNVQGNCDDTIHMLYTYRLYFDDQRDYSDLDAIYNKIAKNGKVELDCVDASDSDFSETMISAALANKYVFDGFWIYGGHYDGKDTLTISSGEKWKQYDVTYVYQKANEFAKRKVSEVVKKMNYTRNEIFKDYNKRFIVEDLESINYLYSTRNVKDNADVLNSIVNYSSKIHKLADNANIDFIFDVRAGGTDSDFYEMNMGPIDISYNGIIYDYVDPIGYALTKIIYVPDDTEKTREAFIKAAKERINKYLKGVNVEITYGGKLSDLEEEQYSWNYFDMDTQTSTLIKLFDFDRTNGEWYKIKIDEREYPYFILTGSDKMNTPYVKTVDVNTNVYVTTDAYEAPLDSRISANRIDENSEIYKLFSKKLNIIKGLIYNISMYSTSLDTYVSKLSNGNFKVYIPVTSEVAKKSLVAVYLKDDGTKEEYKVSIENGYAVFETNHFSTYALIEKKDTNPDTYDNIIMYISLLLLSVIGLFLVGKKIKSNI